MSKLRLLSLAVTVAIGLAASAYAAAYLVASSGAEATTQDLGARAKVVAEVPEASTQIAFWSTRIAEQPDAYLDLTLLGQAFARKARETSDVGYYVRAEAALRRALRINPRYVAASSALAGVLLATHDFTGALSTAAPIVARPDGVQALAALGDANLALGRYVRARAAYARLVSFSPSAAAYSRLAFLSDLRGDTTQARRLLERATQLARDAGESGESLAWYEFQLGENAFKTGMPERAESRYRAALAIFPRYPLALAGLAKARAAQGDLSAAVALYRRATTIVPQPDYLAALGDLYAKAGDARAAREAYATVAVIGTLSRATKQVYNRQLAVFYADRGSHLGLARRLALDELHARKDVFGYDAAAWALARSGNCHDALALARRALRLGTRDALLWFHRGYAEGCAGDRAAMLESYARALEINPSFSIRWAPVARAALDGRPGA
jgi:tetratricopeptide (TPR) repeat protein